MMPAGDSRYLFDVQRLTETPQADGTVQQTRASAGSLWLSIEPIRGREFLEAAAMAADVTHRHRGRYFESLVPARTDQLVSSGRTFNVEQVMQRPELGTVEVMSKEVV